MRNFIKKNKKTLIFFFAFTLIVLILKNSTDVKSAVYSSFFNSLENIIPSLFPGLVLTTFVSQIGFPGVIKKLFSFVFNSIFGIPPSCSEIMFFGLTSGYPTGVKTARLLTDKGLIGMDSAKRVSLISVSPGIIYTVITVGKIQYGSAKVGVILYCCILLSQVAVGIISKQRIIEDIEQNKKVKREKIGEQFCNSVKNSSDACFSMTAWISLFGAFGELMKKIPLGNGKKYFELFLEVTTGVSAAIKRSSIEQCAFSLGFGGLCIMFQLLPDLIKLNIRPTEYLSCRFAVGLLSALIAKLFRNFLPIVFLPAFSHDKSVNLSANNAPGFLSILFLCVIFMYSLANRFAM